MTPRRRAGLVAVVVSVVAMACGDTGDEATTRTAADGIRVASFDFPESVLLAEMYAQVIESTGTPVVRLGAIGPREIIAPAIELGHIDFVPEYLGSALRVAGAAEPNPDTRSAVLDLRERLMPRAMTVLNAAPAQDRNVIAVTEEMAEEHGLRAISDLAPLASTLRIGGPPECPDRPLCLVGLEEVYGLHFAEFVAQRSLRFTAEALRRDEIDVGVMFSTDASLVAFDLVVLEDDRAMQPAENVVPIVRTEALVRWGPDVATAVNGVSAELTTLELRILNVQIEDGPVEAVAREWLAAHHLVE